MELNYQEENKNASNIMYHAQLIADAFADSLKKNNCMLMIPVSFHQEINDAVKDILDLEDLGEYRPDDSYAREIDSEVIDGNVINALQEAINYSKARCINCDLVLPSIDFNYNLDAVMGRLDALLNLYNDMFKLNSLDFCQASYATRKSCLPDLLKLIILLVTAIATIIMLINIKSISVLAFIKGIISTILQKIFGSFKMAISIGGMNTACLVNALKEVADSLLPTHERMMAGLDQQAKIAIGDYSFQNDMLDDLDGGLNKSSTKLKEIEDSIDRIEDELNDTFKIVSDTIDLGMKKLNEYIASLLQFKSTFECEAKRSGTDIEEVLRQVNRLIQVTNLLSASAMAVAKKDARDQICASDKTINKLSDEELEDLITKDVIEELYEKEAELVESPDNGIQILIHDKPKEASLPKLDLFQCNLDDFIKGHDINNVITIAEDQVKKEIKDALEKSGGSSIINKNTKPIGEGSYVFKKPDEGQLTTIDNIVNILYSKPPTVEEGDVEEDKTVPLDFDKIENIIKSDTVSSSFKETNPGNTTINCRTIEDVMSILDQIRR